MQRAYSQVPAKGTNPAPAAAAAATPQLPPPPPPLLPKGLGRVCPTALVQAFDLLGQFEAENYAEGAQLKRPQPDFEAEEPRLPPQLRVCELALPRFAGCVSRPPVAI